MELYTNTIERIMIQRLRRRGAVRLHRGCRERHRTLRGPDLHLYKLMVRSTPMLTEILQLFPLDSASNHVDMTSKVILITSRRALRSFYEYDY